MADSEEIQIPVEGHGTVSGLLQRPAKPRWLLLLAHGAGAGMRHRFMEALANELARVDIATLRYQFPYMERPRRSAPDPPAVLVATVAATLQAASKVAPGLPLLAGGKSLGGLHPPNTPGIKRADHLPKVPMPMLFLQGTRDTLADLKLLRPICEKLGPRATLHIIDSADHSFHVLQRSGMDDEGVLRHLAETTASWAGQL